MYICVRLCACARLHTFVGVCVRAKQAATMKKENSTVIRWSFGIKKVKTLCSGSEYAVNDGQTSPRGGTFVLLAV